MTDPELEMLSAFLDGEPIDPRELAHVLSRPDSVEVLRDFLRLGSEVRSDETLPSQRFYGEANRLLSPSVQQPAWWRRVAPVPITALAAVLFAIACLGFWIGFRGIRQTAVTETPPVPDRVILFEPGVDWDAGAGNHDS